MPNKMRGRGTYKYRTYTNFYTHIPISSPVHKIQIDYETDNFIRINGYRQAKVNRQFIYHDTFEQAITHVKHKAQQQIAIEKCEHARKIETLKDIINEVNNLKEKEL